MTRRSSHAHAEDYRVRNLGTDALPLFGAPPAETQPARQVPVRAHLRRVDGPEPPTGEERRDAALDAHAQKAAVRSAVVYIRARLLELYRLRRRTDENAAVSADDVDEIIRTWPQFPSELRDVEQHWRAVVFRAGFEKTGRYVQSTRASNHAHEYPTWRPLL